jgi:hypothetical protein
MAPQLVNDIAKELLDFPMPEAETIVTGTDEHGAHIFVIANGELSCRDNVGFAAIGVGYWHANSYLMFAGHTRAKLLPETLLAAYSAKRRAEVAPGVGPATDMFMVGLGKLLGSYTPVASILIDTLEHIYQTERDSIGGANRGAVDAINQYVTKVITDAAAAASAPGGSQQPAEQKQTPAGEAPLGEPKKDKAGTGQ